MKIVTTWLNENGWKLMPLHDLFATASLRARKGPTTLAIKCTGSDRPLLGPHVADLKQIVVLKGYHPVFIYGEQIDPRIWGYIRPNADIILPIDAIDELPEKIHALTPTLVGTIDTIQAPNIISGWTLISPYGKVTINAYVEGRVIGTCETCEKKTRPDGVFRFVLKISEEMPIRQVLQRVYVRALMSNGKSWPIPPIDNVRLLPAA